MTWKAKRNFVFQGVQYHPGDTIPAKEMAKSPEKQGSLVRAGFITDRTRQAPVIVEPDVETEMEPLVNKPRARKEFYKELADA